MVDHRIARTVELGRQMRLCNRKAHRVCNALTQRAGSGLNAHGVTVLGMAGGQRAPLTELLNVVHRQAVAA